MNQTPRLADAARTSRRKNRLLHGIRFYTEKKYVSREDGIKRENSEERKAGENTFQNQIHIII